MMWLTENSLVDFCAVRFVSNQNAHTMKTPLKIDSFCEVLRQLKFHTVLSKNITQVT